MEAAVAMAIGHMSVFIHPQVYVTDNGAEEEAPFIRAVRAKIAEDKKTLIELPTDAVRQMLWMTRLDSGSLSGELCGKGVVDLADEYSLAQYIR